MRSGNKVTKLGLGELLKNSCVIPGRGHGSVPARGPSQDSGSSSQLYVSDKPLGVSLLLKRPLEALPAVVLIRFRIPSLKSVNCCKLLFL